MEHYELEESLLKKLKQAYDEYDFNHIRYALADDVTYDSIWVIDQITSKAEYTDYMNAKLRTMKNSETRLDLQIMYDKNNYRPHLVIMYPKTVEGGNGCFTIEVEDNLIKAIHLTPVEFYVPMIKQIPIING